MMDFLVRMSSIAFFVPYFMYELLVANLRVALNVTARGHTVRPAIIAVETRAQGDLQVILLANLVSLTPGTLVVDVSSDHSVMFVHTMHIRDLDNFNKFEDRFLRMFR